MEYSQNPMGYSQNLMGYSKNPMGYWRNPIRNSRPPKERLSPVIFPHPPALPTLPTPGNTPATPLAVVRKERATVVFREKIF